jgi:hypothetical protein
MRPSLFFTYGAVISLVLLIVSTPECYPQLKPVIIEPGKFSEHEISLSEIADDINYITLDNSLPVQIYPGSINILKNSIFLSARDIGIIRFGRDGSNPVVIGKKGRGPGEWRYCMSIAADDKGEKVYVMDADNDIKVYGSNGSFVRSIQLPKSEDGYNFSGISMFGSRLFAAEYINMGHATYNWLVLDTDGKTISYKKNPIPTFKCNLGMGGGTYIFGDRIFYWNSFNDTIYSISPDLNYRASYVFSYGEEKLPLAPIISGPDFPDVMGRYYIPVTLLESNRFLFYKFSHEKKVQLALLEKKTGKTYVSKYASVSSGGIKNDIDGGVHFNPVHYFTQDNHEFLVSIVEPLALKKLTAAGEFANASVKYPDKKKYLKSLSERISETDNPILMIVRLK